MARKRKCINPRQSSREHHHRSSTTHTDYAYLSSSSSNSSSGSSDVKVVKRTRKGATGASNDSDTEDEENSFVIDKILGSDTRDKKDWDACCRGKTTRFLQHGSIFVRDDNSDNKGNKSTEDGDSKMQEDEERFLIKWKNLSYLHVSWETEEELLSYDPQAKAKLQRFREKQETEYSEPRNGYFNPEYCIVDRVLDAQDEPQDGFSLDVDVELAYQENRTRKPLYLLVKWKSLPYDQVTWELQRDVMDDQGMRDYHDRARQAVRRYKQQLKISKQGTKSLKRTFRGYTISNPPPFKSIIPYEKVQKPCDFEQETTMQLRDYQLIGVNWLLLNWYQHRNSMLADEMGLGKTLQTVTFINHLVITEGLTGPYIIIAPLSTLTHWQREFAKWTNLNAIVYHGTHEARKLIERYEFYLSEAELEKATNSKDRKKSWNRKSDGSRSDAKRCYRFDVLITTYEMFSAADSYRLTRIHWQVAVVDEAHRLKNRNSKAVSVVKKSLRYRNILLLTGTPLQNNIEELWTLLHLLDESRFRSLDTFLEKYGELKDHEQVQKLNAELKPYLLRRLKEHVETSLAPKEETIIEVELTVLQKQYYRAIYEKNTEFLMRGNGTDKPSLMNVMMELRKCCNHPFLIKGVEARESLRISQQTTISEEGKSLQMRELLVTSSGKLILLDKLLPLLKENGHRVLIFSQFKIMLDILQDYLRLRSFYHERIDGDITGNDRQAAIDRFCSDTSQALVMLISTRAGGVGINLTAADTVIIYDSDWNPQNDLQAQARCHRIGQKKSVKIYRLLTAKTYELRMFHQASIKLGLDQAVLCGAKDENHALMGNDSASSLDKKNSKLSKDQVETLLRYGAYEIFNEEKEGEAEAASKRFSEESIHEILQRSTKIVHDPKSTEADGKGALMASFSKATFTSSLNPNDEVDINDPDFWSKIVCLDGSNVPQAHSEALILERQDRQCRKRAKTYVVDSGDELKYKVKSKIKDGDVEYIMSDVQSDSSDTDTDHFADIIPEQLALAKKSDAKDASPAELPFRTIVQHVSAHLFRFGYNNWDAIDPNSAIRKLPITIVKEYAQRYISTCIRLATQDFLDRQVRCWSALRISGIAASGANVNAAKEALADCSSEAEVVEYGINAFTRQYEFVKPVLRDAKVVHMGQIQHFSELLVMKQGTAIIPPQTKKETQVNLNQYERMYQLHLLVEQKLAPIQPIIKVLKACQQSELSLNTNASLGTQILGQNRLLTLTQMTGQNLHSSTHGACTVGPTVILPTSSKAEQTTQLNSASTPSSSAISETSERAAYNGAVHQLKQLPILPPGIITPATWWAPIVDDVLLLIFIHSYGYIRLNKLFLKKLVKSNLFHVRLKQYPLDKWPTSSLLNRRARHVLSVWSKSANVASTQPIRTAEPPQANPIALAQKPIAICPPQLSRASSNQLQLRQQRQRLHFRVSEKEKNAFAKLVFYIGIPDTKTCASKILCREKWRYFLQEPELAPATKNMRSLEQMAISLELYCVHKTPLQHKDPIEEWHLSYIQTRRILDRIEIFRLLRTETLLFSPKRFLAIVYRAITQIRAEDANTQFPPWWDSPTHDATLLQGVEYHGFGMQMARVWEFAAFKKATMGGIVPQVTWVENYMISLVRCCHDLIANNKSLVPVEVAPNMEETTPKKQVVASEIQTNKIETIAVSMEEPTDLIVSSAKTEATESLLMQQHDSHYNETVREYLKYQSIPEPQVKSQSSTESETEFGNVCDSSDTDTVIVEVPAKAKEANIVETEEKKLEQCKVQKTLNLKSPDSEIDKDWQPLPHQIVIIDDSD